MYRDTLNAKTFKSAATVVATNGGALMIVTPDKKHWLGEVKAHCTPCTTVWIRDPFSGDGPGSASCILVDRRYKSKRGLGKWIKRCKEIRTYRWVG